MLAFKTRPGSRPCWETGCDDIENQGNVTAQSVKDPGGNVA